MVYTRRRIVGNLNIVSISLNKPSDKALNKLAKEIILIEKRGDLINAKSSNISA